MESPFPSSLGLSIPNSHQVDENLYRGMGPIKMQYIHDLLKLEITDILIFKNQTRGEVDKEIADLLSVGYSKANIHQVDFLWHDFPSHAAGCKLALRGLKLLKQLQARAKKTYFHCTVGEDRTGLLAGLWGLSKDKKLETLDVFKQQMCENGYGAGNPNKPPYVVNEIRKWLTPIYLKLAKKLKEKSLSEISESECRFTKKDKLVMSAFKCKKSSKFPQKD